MALKKQRQAAVLEAVRKQKLASQEQVIETLARKGINASQSTVSRDIRELGLLKVRDSSGRIRYGEPPGEADANAADDAFRRMATQFLLSVEATGNLVVAKTSPGNAQGLAAALDAASVKGVAGTVAGDDTVLVVCSEGAQSKKIGKKLMEYALGQG